MDILSPELTDLIIDELHNDVVSLVALRAVSRIFYPRTTYYLFYRVHASTKSQFDSLTTGFQASPFFCTFVKHFHITFLSDENDPYHNDQLVELKLLQETDRNRKAIDEAKVRNHFRRAARDIPLDLLPNLETFRITHSPQSSGWKSTTVTSSPSTI
ncbi:uncharacterized protein BT62DRAFT_935240 [Guyanagaster necrorhizus]|uniref:Uncharacterized protein n=1 Tax=Guyanagaster necrorhizus TaxID=856835 RepID=A0A9P8AQX8_9AGAR|nr:uncharacterized protein BT62DRAFT_935240 [Guyanagaster necrorhizus MCA 3950]KAG7443302.1 hypothetical protein BT62DRAFT_935240 [Guyanagaster necrorhizus MCA 3950]